MLLADSTQPTSRVRVPFRKEIHNAESNANVTEDNRILEAEDWFP
jgi:hypothetical protein